MRQEAAGRVIRHCFHERSLSWERGRGSAQPTQMPGALLTATAAVGTGCCVLLRAGCRQDVEIEMDRFENARDATLAKYRMMQRPKGKVADGLNLAVDGIATLCMGE